MADQAEQVADDTLYDDDGWEGYEATTVDPGEWFFPAVALIASTLMFCLMPFYVCRAKQRKRHEKEKQKAKQAKNRKHTKCSVTDRTLAYQPPPNHKNAPPPTESPTIAQLPEKISKRRPTDPPTAKDNESIQGSTVPLPSLERNEDTSDLLNALGLGKEAFSDEEWKILTAQSADSSVLVRHRDMLGNPYGRSSRPVSGAPLLDATGNIVQQRGRKPKDTLYQCQVLDMMDCAVQQEDNQYATMTAEDDQYGDEETVEGGPPLSALQQGQLLDMEEYRTRKPERKQEPKSSQSTGMESTPSSEHTVATWSTHGSSQSEGSADGLMKERREPYISASGLDVNGMKKVRASCWTVLWFDKETRRILGYAIPFTFSALSSSVLTNVCLALVGHHTSAKHLAAYAIVGIFISLTEEFLKGPIYASTSLCAHAIGAGNNFLAGQYVQLSVILYLFTSIPCLVLWTLYIDEVILWLEWGDEAVAQHATEYTRIAVWSCVFNSLAEAVSQLLDVTDHEIFTTVMGLVESLADVLALVVIIECGIELTLELTAWAYLAVSFTFFSLTLIISYRLGWLKPFAKGIFRGLSITNTKAVINLVRTSIPIAFGSALSSAEWVVLTFFAAKLGPAEVAAWAVLGSIWEVFDATTQGIGESAEIRVAYHVGNNHPSLAKLSAYKTLVLGAVVSCAFTGVFVYFIDEIPGWFTPDQVLQEMLAQSLPLICVGNIVLTMGMLCWYMLGAQGRYKLGTWVNFIVSWAITMPLAAVSVYVLNLNLSGLTAAVVLGYAGMGATLSYLLLTSDWAVRTAKIQERNYDSVCGVKSERSERTVASEDDDREDDDYADLVASQNIKLFTAPPGPLDIRIGHLSHRTGLYVLEVDHFSPFYGRIFQGDEILSIDGRDVSHAPVDVAYDLLAEVGSNDRQLAVMTCHYRDEDSFCIRRLGNVPDIPDFEESGEVVRLT